MTDDKKDPPKETPPTNDPPKTDPPKETATGDDTENWNRLGELVSKSVREEIEKKWPDGKTPPTTRTNNSEKTRSFLERLITGK